MNKKQKNKAKNVIYYQCAICNQLFATRELLHTHQSEVHGSVRDDIVDFFFGTCDQKEVKYKINLKNFKKNTESLTKVFKNSTSVEQIPITKEPLPNSSSMVLPGKEDEIKALSNFNKFEQKAADVKAEKDFQNGSKLLRINNNSKSPSLLHPSSSVGIFLDESSSEEEDDDIDNNGNGDRVGAVAADEDDDDEDELIDKDDSENGNNQLLANHSKSNSNNKISANKNDNKNGNNENPKDIDINCDCTNDCDCCDDTSCVLM